MSMLNRWIPIAAVVAALTTTTLQPAEAFTVNDLLRGAAIAAQGLFITDAQEVQLGQATVAQILQQYPLVRDPALNAYVTGVGRKVAAVSDRPNLAYQFFIIDSKDINAFAAPGGFVFVTTAALRFMQDEAQLAGVLAHEVGHVAKKHSVSAIRKQLVAQGIASAVLGEHSSQLVAIAANIGAGLILKGFDRKAELEADQLGAVYAYRANYDPVELTRFLGALGKAVGETPEWLQPVSDHPRSDDRVVKLNALLAQPAFKARKALVVNRAGYQSAVIARLGALAAPTPVPSVKPSGG
jgi:predicted Zn-dependent protease